MSLSDFRKVATGILAFEKVKQNLFFEMEEKKVLYQRAALEYQFRASKDDSYRFLENYQRGEALSDEWIESKHEQVLAYLLEDDLYIECLLSFIDKLLETGKALLKDKDSTLPNKEKAEVETKIRHALELLLHIDRLRLEEELKEKSPRIKSNHINSYIQNSVVEEWQYLLSKEYQQIDLSNLDLTRINYQGDVTLVNFKGSKLKEANFSKATVNPNQLLDSIGYSSIEPISLREEVQNLKFKLLQHKIQHEQTKIAILQEDLPYYDWLDNLVCSEVPPHLTHLDKNQLRWLFVMVVNSSRLNELPSSNPYYYPKIAERIQKDGDDFLDTLDEKQSEKIILEILAARNYTVTKADILIERLNKLSIKMQYLANLFLIEKDITTAYAELNEKQQKYLLEELKRFSFLRKQAENSILEQLQQYEYDYVNCLLTEEKGIKVLKQQTLEEVVALLSDSPHLSKIVIDLSRVDLAHLNFKKFDMSKVHIKMTKDQRKFHLTEEQRKEEIKVFLKAVDDNNLDEVNRWVECGINIEAVDEAGRNALSKASFKGYIDMVRYLLKQGADPDKKKDSDWYIVDGVCMNLEENSHMPEIAKLLLAKSNTGNLVSFMRLKDLSLLKIKLNSMSQNEIKNFKSPAGRSLLIEAIWIGDESLVAMLINEFGLNPDEVDNNDNTALHVAASKGESEIVKIILKAYPYINIEAKNGKNRKESERKTPLQQASYQYFLYLRHTDSQERLKANQYLKIVEILEGKGAKLNQAARIILYKDSGLVIREAKQNGMDENNQSLLHMIIECNNIELLRGALESANGKLNLNQIFQGETLLAVACRQGHLDIVRLLVEEGAKVDSIEPYCEPPLFLAVKNQHEKIVKYLLDKEVNINLKYLNNTVLHIAAKSGNIPIVNLLLEKGAKWEERNSLGQLPLHIATEHNFPNVAKKLATAYFKVEDNHQQSPIRIAKEKGYNEISSIFKPWKDKRNKIKLKITKQKAMTTSSVVTNQNIEEKQILLCKK